MHHDCGWDAAYFKHFALAVGDCSPEEGRAFHERAREAGVPVNVIDQPEFCQFKFGSIFNRSPLVIGISTDGAAPILAQTVRRKIEALLPHSLKRWAELAQMMRGRVNRLLKAIPARRRFWERFADLAFDGSADPVDAEELLKVVERATGAKAPSRISVVGAGPGDAELLTLKAVRALQAADVILFDDHIPADVLELARREARRIAVDATLRRDRSGDGFAMALDLVRAGSRVVRLVSGDPVASASACGEIAAYRREEVFVEVIRGIKAEDGLAAPLALRSRADSVLPAGHHHRAAGRVPAAAT